jgi:hypothetical protein
VTKRRAPLVDRARPEVDPGTGIEAVTWALAVSNWRTRLAVAQAMNSVLPSLVPTKAVGERHGTVAGKAAASAAWPRRAKQTARIIKAFIVLIAAQTHQAFQNGALCLYASVTDPSQTSRGWI